VRAASGFGVLVAVYALALVLNSWEHGRDSCGILSLTFSPQRRMGQSLLL
jgi:hypothetical protein